VKFTREHDESFNGVEGWKLPNNHHYGAFFAYPCGSIVIVDAFGIYMYDNYRSADEQVVWHIEKPLTVTEAHLLVSIYEKMSDQDLVSLIKLTASLAEY